MLSRPKTSIYYQEPMDSMSANVMTDQLSDWCEQVLQRQLPQQACVLGLISGHRDPNDLRAIARIARVMADGLAQRPGRGELLVCRLDIQPLSLDSTGQPSTAQVEPRIDRSALGNWSAVEVPLPIGKTASWSLRQLPRWLLNWRMRYSMVLIDLGPIHLVPSRVVGRLCDENYLLLGPTSCASAQWLMQHIDFHEYCGSRVTGSLVINLAA